MLVVDPINFGPDKRRPINPTGLFRGVLAVQYALEGWQYWCEKYHGLLEDIALLDINVCI